MILPPSPSPSPSYPSLYRWPLFELLIKCFSVHSWLFHNVDRKPTVLLHSCIHGIGMYCTVVVLAEDYKLCSRLKKIGILAETIQQVEHTRSHPVKILPFRHLMKIYEHLGVSKKMGLTGRPPHMLGVIATSQLYSYALHSQHMFAFTPQVSSVAMAQEFRDFNVQECLLTLWANKFDTESTKWF